MKIKKSIKYKPLQKAMAFFMAIVLSIMTLAITANAAWSDNSTISFTGSSTSYDESGHQGQLHTVSIDGQSYRAYCLDSVYDPFPNGTATATNGGYVSQEIQRIINYCLANGVSDPRTQGAIRRATQGAGAPSTWGGDSIVNAAYAAKDNPAWDTITPSVSLSGGSGFTTVGSVRRYTFTVGVSGGNWSGAYTASSSNGNATISGYSGNNFTVDVPITATANSSTITVNPSGITFSGTRGIKLLTHDTNNDYQDLVVLDPQATISGASATANLAWETMQANVSLQKTSTNAGGLVSGFRFRLYNDETNSLISTKTTDGNGKIDFGDYLPGRYRIEEINLSSEYVGEAPKVFNLTAGNNVTISFNNTRKLGKVRVYKTQTLPDPAFDYSFANTYFAIYAAETIKYPTGEIIYSQDQKVAEQRITPLGERYGYDYTEFEGLPLGKYYVVETVAANGYSPTTQTFEIRITADLSDTEIVRANDIYIENTQITGQIIVHKTSANAAYTSANLEHYALNGAAYEIRAVNEITNRKGTVIYSANEVAEVIYTSVTGYAMSQKLPLGNYTVKEITPSKGFALDSKTYNVEVTEGDKTLAIIPHNVESTEPVLPRIGIVKTGEMLVGAAQNGDIYTPIYESRPLAGCVFEVRAAENIRDYKGTIIHASGTVVATLTTAETKVLTDPVLPGKYTITEISAPINYVIDSTPKLITVAAATSSTEAVEYVIEIDNPRKKADITLTKLMEQGFDETYAAVRFALFAEEDILAVNGSIAIPYGSKIEIFGVDENGVGVIQTDLPAGYKYYVREIATHQAYLLNEMKWEFEIKW